MKQQAFNPYLPSYEYVPDGEPHVFGDRIYIYGSHDRFNGYTFCMNEYVCWSAPVDDLSDWRQEGIIYPRSEDPFGRTNHNLINHAFAAPDVCQGPDGRYYLYYFIADGYIKVAVCDEPAGHYKYYGVVHYADGIGLGKKKEPKMFDPGVFVDDDGKIFLFSGFGLGSNPLLLNGEKPTEHGAMFFELESDMLTIKKDSEEVRYVGIPGRKEGKGTAFEGHEFLEASSMRKFEGKYYFIYSSMLSHELCYAVSDNPVTGFQFGGILISNGDIGYEGRKAEDALNFTGNTHGSIEKIGDKYYVFYHRQTYQKQFSRQGCAEELRFEDGKFYQAEMTSCGLNGKPLDGKGKYEARIACNLQGKNGTRFYGAFKGIRPLEPYFTQTGKDREDHPDQYIANIRDGAKVGFKYFLMEEPKRISVIGCGNALGIMEVRTKDEMEIIAEISIQASREMKEFEAKMKPVHGKQALYFQYRGKGRFDFHEFKLD